MDIQFCQDPFAVATYICDYLMKTEDGMTELFKAALKENPSLQQKDKQNLLKTIYLTHRQVGLCEAIYRLIPSMKMKDSNITTTFVSSGFPQNRCSFVSKFREESEDEDELETDNWETQDHRWEQNDRIEDERSNGVIKNNSFQYAGIAEGSFHLKSTNFCKKNQKKMFKTALQCTGYVFCLFFNCG